MTTQFVVAPAVAENKLLLEHLYQLYLYDLSAYTMANVGSDGLFPAPCLCTYVANPGHAAFCFRLDHAVIGFALVSQRNLFAPGLAGCTCDALFVLRQYRRKGYGQAAAHAMFNQFPGHWHVFARDVNVPGCTFWRAVVDRYTQGRYHEQWLRTPEGRSNVQSFVVVP